MYRIKDKLIYIFFWFVKFPLLYFFCKRAGKILKEWNDVSIQQLRLLMDIISSSDKSDFGKKYKFNDIKSVEQFRKNVTISTYERVSPYVKDILLGNSRALFNKSSLVKDFIATSGTGGHPKVLPLTKKYVSEIKSFWTLWGTFVFKDHRELIGRRIFHTVNSEDYFETSNFFPDLTDKIHGYNTCKDTTGVISSKIPKFIRDGFRVPSFVSTIKHHKLRYYCALRFSCVDENLKLMVGVSPWNFLIYNDILNEFIEVLLLDLKNGWISLDKFQDVGQDDIKLLERYRSFFRKDKYSYDRITKIYQTKKELVPSDIWPSISLIACWSQSQFHPVCERIRKLYNCPNIRDIGLVSSEGSFSIPISDNSDEGLLNLDWGFYEFIPEEEYEQYVEENSVEYSSQIKPLLAHEIQSGKRYYMIITTYQGLFRYDQKDLIECSGHYKNIPLIRFIRKVKNVSDTTGEKITDIQVAETCEYLFDKYGLNPFYMSVHPVCTTKESYYELLVPSGKLDNMDSREVEKDFDSKMSDLNCVFREHIQTAKLKPTRIVVKSDEFWEKLKTGKPIDRYKHPYIIRDII